MRTREYDSVFLKTQVCAECGGFETDTRPLPPREVCPRCGGALKTEIGRFRVRETWSLFGGSQREYLSFTLKAETEVSMHKTTNEETREASGNVEDARPLVCFLYLLLRDELPAGRVEKLVMLAEETAGRGPERYTNGWLAQYAQNLADRLTKP